MANREEKKDKRGGPRKILTWQEKLTLTDRAVVAQFLCDTACGCDNDCLFKLLNIGEQGVQVVVDLRDDRFAKHHVGETRTCSSPESSSTSS